MNTDRIEKQIVLHAPRARVWRALADSAEFCAWFGMQFDGPFAPGARLHGVIVGTTVDAGVAEAQKQHAGTAFEITIEDVEPERRFSFRWHPHAVEPGVDYSAEPTTLIAFTLEEVADGILLTVTESGFDQIPLDRRAKALASNDQGWAIMVTMIERYVAGAP
ncbi:MAG: SRPBCC family protein [Bryobacteraceae bacterium]|jgi:uncharacterized protein YndB with AHSA1/START domain